MNRNFDQERNNPCLKEQNLTYKCLSDNNYDKDECVKPIENYKTCKGFWMSVQAQRKQKGERPYLPLPEERQKIKEEYFAKHRN